MRLIFLLLIIPACCNSQTLANLKTRKEIEKFIKDNFKLEGYNYNSFYIDSAAGNPVFVEKGDFNHDGIGDLMVFGTATATEDDHLISKDFLHTYNGHELVILLGDPVKPRKAVFPHRFFWNQGIYAIHYQTISGADGMNFIQQKYELIGQNKPRTIVDELFIEHDHVMPVARESVSKAIARVEFKTSDASGPPVFEMTIDKDRKIKYNGIGHVAILGKYRLVADQRDWDYLVRLINSLNVDQLNDRYAVSWTDAQTGYLTVVYADGSQKKIEDYGLAGSFGLSVLYDYLYELRRH